MRIINSIISILIVGLFLYSKLLPYKDKLDTKYRKVFDFFNTIYAPIFNFFKTFIKPFKLGTGLSVDMTQIVLLILFLVILNSL